MYSQHSGRALAASFVGLALFLTTLPVHSGLQEERFAARKLNETTDWNDKARVARLCRLARVEALEEAIRQQCAEALREAALKGLKEGNTTQAGEDLAIAKRAGLNDQEHKTLAAKVAALDTELSSGPECREARKYRIARDGFAAQGYTESGDERVALNVLEQNARNNCAAERAERMRSRKPAK